MQFDTCTVSYTCQTVRHMQFDVKRASDELHNLTRVLEYTCQNNLTRVLEYTCQIVFIKKKSKFSFYLIKIKI